MSIYRRGQEASKIRRDANVSRVETVDQLHHPLVLVIDHIARLSVGLERAAVERDGHFWTSYLFETAVDGAVVAGEEGRDGDLLGFELGHFGELGGDYLGCVGAGEIRSFGVASCLERVD